MGALLAFPACGEEASALFTEDGAVPDADVPGEAPDGAAHQPGRGTPQAEDADEGSAMPDGGSSDAESGPPTLLTVKLACDMRAERGCTRLLDCAPFTLRALYGKVESCRARESAACAAEARLSDGGHTTYTLARCAQELADTSCPQIVAGTLPEACAPAGKRRETASCAAHSQCASGFCAVGASGCGTCKTRQRLGDPCSWDGGCLRGLVCNAQGKCSKPGELDDVCDDRLAPCQSHLACVEGRCAATLAPGAACVNSQQCARSDGYLCGPMLAPAATAPIVCRMTPLGAPGDVCRVDGNITAHCPGGPSMCANDGTGTFRCRTIAKDGDPCGAEASGAACEAGARCMGGVCRLGPATTCDP